MNNRRAPGLCLAMLLFTALVCGCVKQTDAGASGKEQAPPASGSARKTASAPGNELPSPEDIQSYYFVADGTVLYPDMDVTVLPEGLSEPDSMFESESCAAQGIAKLYAWKDFEILTCPDKQAYPDPETDRIQYIYLKTDNVQTPEGADLSTSREAVERIYGRGGDGSDDKQLVYPLGTMRLVFVFGEDGYPVSIEYRSDVMRS